MSGMVKPARILSAGPVSGKKSRASSTRPEIVVDPRHPFASLPNLRGKVTTWREKRKGLEQMF